MTQRLLIVSLLLTAFISAAYGMGIYLFGTLAPAMRDDLGLTQEMVGRISGICQAGTILASLAVGSVWGRIGARETMIGAQAIIALGMVVAAFSTGPVMIGSAVAVLGMMAASSWIALVPLVQAVIPSHRRGIVLGLASSGLAYGVFLVGVVAPFLITHFGWRSVWLAAGLYAFLLVVLGLVVFRGLPKIARSAPAASAAQAAPGTPNAGTVFTLGGIVMIAINFFAGIAFHPFQTFLTLYFRDAQDWSTAEATALWSAIGLGGMIGGVLIGWIADRFGARFGVALCYGLLTIATATVWLWPEAWPATIALMLFGMGYNAVWGLFAAWIAEHFTAGPAGRLMGLTLVASGIGATMGNYSAGLITSAAGGYARLYMLVTLLAGLSLLLTLLLDGRPAKRVAP